MFLVWFYFFFCRFYTDLLRVYHLNFLFLKLIINWVYLILIINLFFLINLLILNLLIKHCDLRGFLINILLLFLIWISQGLIALHKLRLVHKLLNYWDSNFWHELHLFGARLGNFIFHFTWDFWFHVLLFDWKDHGLVGLLKLMLVESHLLLELLLHELLLKLKLVYVMLGHHYKWHHSHWRAWLLLWDLFESLILMMLNPHDHGLNLLTKKRILKRHPLHLKYMLMILLHHIYFLFLIMFLIILFLFVFLCLLRINIGIDIIILLNYIYLEVRA